MSNPSIQCCAPGCGTIVPAELKLDGCCVSHYLASADKVCGEIRREAATGDASATRLAEFLTYVADSAMKLALIGTGSVRLSDEMKKRLLTTFLTLMILRENLERPSNLYAPRPRSVKPAGAALPVAANF